MSDLLFTAFHVFHIVHAFYPLSDGLDTKTLCQVDFIPLGIDILKVGPMYPFDSILTPIFNSVAQNLVESGAIRKMVKRNLPLLEQHCNDQTGSGPDPVDFDLVWVFFRILLGGGVSSFLVVALEKAANSRSKVKPSAFQKLRA